MKKGLEILGIVIALIISFGAFGKVMHLPFANQALILGIGSFVFPFIFLVTVYLYRQGIPGLALAFGAGSLFIYALGNLFLIMHWSGSLAMSLSGTIYLLLTLLATAIHQWSKRPEERKVPVLGLAFMMIAVALIYAASFRTAGGSVLHGFISSNKSFEGGTKIMDSLIRISYPDVDSNSRAITELKNHSDSVVDLVQKDKQLLTHATGIYNKGPQHDDSYAWDNMDISDRIMFETDRANNLRKVIQNYRNFLILNDSIYHTSEAVNDLLDISKWSNDPSNMKSWQETQFYHVPVICAFSNLSAIEYGVRACELNALKKIKMQSSSPVI